MEKTYLFTKPWKIMHFRSGWPISSSEVVTKPSIAHLKFKKGIEYQFSLDNDQYPNTIVAEVDALNNHKCYIKHCEIQKWDQYHSLPE